MQQLPYRRLIAWQKSYALAQAVLDVLDGAPFRRQFDLVSQISRAATSVPANVAEGQGRGTPLDFASFLDRARGSLFELDSWLLLCRERGMVDEARHTSLQSDLLEVNAILLRLRDSMRERARTQHHRPG